MMFTFQAKRENTHNLVSKVRRAVLHMGLWGPKRSKPIEYNMRSFLGVLAWRRIEPNIGTVIVAHDEHILVNGSEFPQFQVVKLGHIVRLCTKHGWSERSWSLGTANCAQAVDSTYDEELCTFFYNFPLKTDCQCRSRCHPTTVTTRTSVGYNKQANLQIISFLWYPYLTIWVIEKDTLDLHVRGFGMFGLLLSNRGRRCEW